MTRRDLIKLGALATVAPKAMAAAPAPAAVLIPARYSFASIEVEIGGLIFKGITAIDYATVADVEDGMDRWLDQWEKR
jgi:hypothetical protein